MILDNGCLFCRIVSGDIPANVVFDDEISLAFLDHRPLFFGHTLLIPKQHVETLADLPQSLIAPFFQNVQLLSRVVERAMEAEGSFVAMNNRISQSVAHLHVHIVPRRKKDGLKGFFWPRTRYKTEEEILAVQRRIVRAVAELNEL